MEFKILKMLLNKLMLKKRLSSLQILKKMSKMTLRLMNLKNSWIMGNFNSLNKIIMKMLTKKDGVMRMINKISLKLNKNVTSLANSKINQNKLSLKMFQYKLIM